jgi:flagellar protein FlaF
MSHEAYRQAARRTASPRNVEYLAFSEATRRLIEAERTGFDDLKILIEAIHLNRTLWGTLASDCARSENMLPKETRQAIISLANWVGAYSSEVMRKRDALAPLIDVNRIMMDGLKEPAAGN